MKVKLIMIIDTHDSFGDSEEEKLWLENEILIGDGSLILHSNEIGDEVGVVKSCKVIGYTN